MKHDRDEVEFVSSRFAGQEECRTDLGGHPEIDHPNFTRIDAALLPPSGRASVPPPVLPDCTDSRRSLDWRFRAALGNSSAFSFAQLRKFLDDFRCAHCEI